MGSIGERNINYGYNNEVSGGEIESIYYEFDNDNNWHVIEEFAEKIGGHDDIWYATNIEIYDYVQAFKAVRFNLAQTIAENPTNTDIWINKDGKIYKLEAGKTTYMKGN